MSSLFDAVLASNNLDSDLAAENRNKTPKRAADRRPHAPSSSRPRGPPTESLGARSDDEGLPDDEVVGARGTTGRPRNPMDRAVPRVVDAVGEKVQESFEQFLET
jgi:DNA replication licensing factor MCM6